MDYAQADTYINSMVIYIERNAIVQHACIPHGPKTITGYYLHTVYGRRKNMHSKLHLHPSTTEPTTRTRGRIRCHRTSAHTVTVLSHSVRRASLSRVPCLSRSIPRSAPCPEQMFCIWPEDLSGSGKAECILFTGALKEQLRRRPRGWAGRIRGRVGVYTARKESREARYRDEVVYVASARRLLARFPR